MNEINDKKVKDVRQERIQWRKKSWSIPDLRGGKQNWFSVIKELVMLIRNGEAINLDVAPELNCISEKYSWRVYAPFLKGIGLAKNQAGVMCLSKEGELFCDNPDKLQLAFLINDRFRLFVEVLGILVESPLTIEEVDKKICELYGVDWNNLSNTRKRMDWLEILDLIEGSGNRKWKVTSTGKEFLNDCIVITPDMIKKMESDVNDIEITDSPAEINILLQKLGDNPELHKERSTYNIWVPSPNRINNLRIITQAVSERIERNELFDFIKKEFNLKTSSAESMLPFLKASGLIEEVGRSVYLATPAAKAWLETGSDLDFIRILHANMQFVGEMIRESIEDTVRNSIYEQGKKYGLNNEKARWIAGFLLEAGLLQETQYLHLKATPMGISFIKNLPLAENIGEDMESLSEHNEEKIFSVSCEDKLDQIVKRIQEASCNPWAEGKASGVAFEEIIAELFRYMGFYAERIGGSGDTDVVVKWKNDEKIVTAIVDAKSKTNGHVSHSDISDVAIDTHKDKNKADYVAIIGADFSGDTIRNHAKKKSYALIMVEQLVDVAHSSKELGLGLQDIALVFKVPNGASELNEIITSKRRELNIISAVVSSFCKEQDELGGLSPRDLLLLLRDTEISPSLMELKDVFEILSQNEIGILQAVDKSLSPENNVYVLSDAKKTVNRLRAIASSIETGLL